jgi:hypothetical protein
MTEAGKNRIMIFGPKADGTYVIEFRTAAGEALAISIPSSETAVLKHFQERMPYGLFVPGPGLRCHLIAKATRRTVRCAPVAVDTASHCR